MIGKLLIVVGSIFCQYFIVLINIFLQRRIKVGKTKVINNRNKVKSGMNIITISTLFGALSIQGSKTKTFNNTNRFDHNIYLRKTTLREDPGNEVSPWTRNLVLKAFSQAAILKKTLRPTNLKNKPAGHTKTLNLIHDNIFHHIGAGNIGLTRLGARELKESRNDKTDAQALTNPSQLLKPTLRTKSSTDFVDKRVKDIGKSSRRYDEPAAKHKVVSQFYFLRNAESKGAVCLDGTKAGFFFRRGVTNKWLVSFFGRAWCSTPLECYKRSASFLGSIKYANKFKQFVPTHGLFSQDPKKNPPFYD